MLIKDVNIVQSDDIYRGNARVENGVIKDISPTLQPKKNEKIIDAKGKYLLPKLIDTNVRVLDDTLSKKNLDTLYQKAKEGGVGRFVLIDDFSPKVENATHLELLKTKVDTNQDVDVVLSVNSQNQEGRLNNIATFLKNGAKVIYTRSDINGNTLVRVMQYAGMKNVPVFCFAEDKDIKNRGVMNEGEVSFELGLPGISKITQISEVSKIVEFATYFDIKILFQGLFTSKSLQILKAVKKTNKKVLTEVPIHNLILSDKECDGFNTKAKLVSPLQEESEREKLIKFLQEGVIDIISSSHSPKSYIYKDVAFEDAKDGVDALNLTLKLGYTYLVKQGIISFEELVKMLCTNPAKLLFKNRIKAIEKGYNDGLILFDPNHKEMVNDESSLYHKKELYGSIEEIPKES
jgi:dihydroorotase